MPIYRLTDEIIFPPPRMATREGILAVGGDLRPERLLLAYSMGIFPWYNDDEPIIWWSPDPRLVLFPGEFHMSKRLQRVIRQQTFEITMDQAFPEVIRACSTTPRPGQNGTWITTDMEAAYIDLHRLGYAHSVESRLDGKLVGGLYGVSLGKCFFGESMFSHVSDASKVALAALVKQVADWGFGLIDCQVETPHLLRMGAREIRRAKFLKLLEEGLQADTRRGKWELPSA